ncbi:MAG: S-methyl-5'-thioinosine phosphorylase [Pseudomonadales bacterium]|nr:S-methyl-5'-thioinosine phosphorylase [Pseudomonadales bacterium]
MSIAIIGGTGLSKLDGFVLEKSHQVITPYGETSSPILSGHFDDTPVYFLARHGSPHQIPPHRINYRANIWALKSLGVKKVISVNAVGGIAEHMGPSHINIPDQIIDYTYRRNGSFCDDDKGMPMHIDFSDPFDEELRKIIIVQLKKLNLDSSMGGVYACTEGPRLESAAEINRLEKDGCDIVGMTVMPEASLAREKDIAYVSLSVVVNKAAGRSEKIITMDDIEEALKTGMANMHQLLRQSLPYV